MKKLLAESSLSANLARTRRRFSLLRSSTKQRGSSKSEKLAISGPTTVRKLSEGVLRLANLDGRPSEEVLSPDLSARHEQFSFNERQRVKHDGPDHRSKLTPPSSSLDLRDTAASIDADGPRPSAVPVSGLLSALETLGKDKVLPIDLSQASRLSGDHDDVPKSEFPTVYREYLDVFNTLQLTLSTVVTDIKSKRSNSFKDKDCIDIVFEDFYQVMTQFPKQFESIYDMPIFMDIAERILSDIALYKDKVKDKSHLPDDLNGQISTFLRTLYQSISNAFVSSHEIKAELGSTGLSARSISLLNTVKSSLDSPMHQVVFLNAKSKKKASPFQVNEPCKIAYSNLVSQLNILLS